ncbi:MAG: hypothetical protein MUO72_06420 [Bacteroidales bacterium]|nr:hypothetical protein [Bacteroidales bacterium]
MTKLKTLIIITSFLPVIALCQDPDGFPSIDKKDLPEAKFSTVRRFNGESLYGYIDGGADLYLEYGFTGVNVTEFTYLKGKYKVEIYKMNNPESAYGIFSVSRFRCRNRPDFSLLTCQNKYQLQICSGQYYISIINGSGTSADSTASIIAGRKIVDKISGPSIDLSEFFPGVSAETIRNESCLIKGRLGVINGSPEMEEYLRELNACTACIVNTPGKTLISARFETKEAYRNFGESHNWEMDRINFAPIEMPCGEQVKRLKDNHVLIEILSAR